MSGHRLGHRLTEAQIQSTPKRSHALQEGYRNLDEGADIEGDPVWIREGGFSEELDGLVQFFAVEESATKKKKKGFRSFTNTGRDVGRGGTGDIQLLDAVSEDRESR